MLAHRFTRTAFLAALMMVASLCLGTIGVLADEPAGATPAASVAVIQPEDGATDVALDSIITVVFSSPVVALTAESEQASLPSPLAFDPPVHGLGEWVNTTIYRFTPTAGLDPSTAYVISLAPDLEDASGAPVTGTSQWTFTTTAPHLISRSPTAPADWTPENPVGGAGPNEPVKMSFAQPMDRESVEAGLSVYYVTDGMQAIEGKIRWFGNTMVFTPAEPWVRGSRVEVSLEGAAAAAGAPLEAVKWAFPVMPELALLASTPADGDKGVYPGSSVMLTFSAPVDPDSFKEQLSIEPETGSLYYWWSSQTKVYVDFYPVAGTEYTVTIGADLMDSRGGLLGEDVSITFTTGDYEPSLQFTDAWQPWAFGDEEEASAFVSFLNVDSFDLSLYEMSLDDAVRYYGDDWQFRSNYRPDKADLLRAWTVETDADLNQWTTISEPLAEEGGPLAPGLYYVTLSTSAAGLQNSVSGQVAIVASHNIVFKWTMDAGLVWVTDWQDGEPAGDVPVQFLDNSGRRFAEAATQADGTALAEMPTQDPWLTYAVVVGEPGSSEFGITLSSWTNGISPWRYGIYQSWYGSPYTVDIYTDRPMYRPGQTVYFKGIVRADNDARYSVPTDLPPLQLVCSDPQGQEILREEYTLNDMGTFYGSVTLSEDAALGQFSLNVSGDELNAWAGFEVAEYRRPEFEVTVTPDQERYVQGDEVKVAIEALYYFGSPVSDAEVQWTVLTQDWYFHWDGGGYYDFSDYDYQRNRDLYGTGSDVLTEGTGHTDEEGRLVISFPADIGDRLASQSFTIEATITDVNAQAVSGRTTVPVQQGEYFIGVGPQSYVIEVGDEAPINVVTVGGDGEAVSGREVELTLYEHRWYNAYEKVGDYYQWTTTEEDVEVSRQTVITGADGKAVATFEPESSGTHKLVATSTDDRGNKVRSSTYFWVSGGGYVAWPMQEDFTFELMADKKSYEVGETAKIMIPSPYQGKVSMLFTSERGQVLDYQVWDLEGSAQVVEVPITEEYAPNVYFTAVLVHGEDDDASLPPFQIGYVSVEVATDALELDVSVTTDRQEAYEPGDTAEFSITAADHDGNPVDAEMSVSLVDKALLALSGSSTTSLVDLFYNQRGLGVQTASLYTLYTRELQRLAAAAGKGGGGGGGGGVREDFPETAYWDPALRTDAEGRATAEVVLPDNLTTWTFEVKAITADTLVGQTTAEIVSTKELLLRTVLPRFLVTGDTAEIGAVVQNNSAEDLSVTVEADLEGLDADLEPQVVTVAAGGRQLVTWLVTAAERGTAVAAFSARGGDLDDAVRQELPVYAMVVPQTVATSGEVDAGEEVLEQVVLPSEYTEGELSVTVEASLVAGMIPGLDYLKHYPYECVEQTLSRFLPNVMTAKALEEVGVDNTALIRDLSQQVGIGLQRLYNNQHGDGGWGWWYNDASNPYLTAYVVWGLVKAQAAGYSVDAYAIDRGTQYLSSVVFELQARSDQEALKLGPEVRAYIAYVLAEAGQGDLGTTVRLYEDRDGLSFRAKAQLLMALAIVSPEETSRLDILVDELEAGAEVTATTTHWEDPVQWRLMNSDAAATATVIQALSRVAPDHPLLPNAVRWLMSVRGRGYWSSTYETAMSILGLTEYMVAKQELLAGYAWSVDLNGREVGSGEFDSENLDEAQTIVVDVYRLLSQEPNALQLNRSPLPDTDTDTGAMYYTASLAYYADAEEIAPVDAGVVVSRQYLAVDDTGSAVHDAELNETVQVKITIVAPTDLWHVVVEDPLPAGCEGLDTSLQTTSSVGVQPQFRSAGDPWGWWWFSHTEMHDDKVVLFATHLPAGTYEYTYYMRASIVGQYNVRPAQAYQMYFPDVFGHSAGETFTVTAAGE